MIRPAFTTTPEAAPTLGWAGILRLGLVQAMLGAIVVLVTVTMNRVMVIELRLPAVLPAALVALHYAVQVLRPAMGHGSDQGGRRTPWIRGGMLLLGVGALAASQAVSLIAGGTVRPAGFLLAVVAYSAIGLGVGTSGTTLLALLSARVEAARRPMAAAVVWIMMIAGIAVTSGLSGLLLQPFSPHRLTMVTIAVAAIAVIVTLLATAGIEPVRVEAGRIAAMLPRMKLRTALIQVWHDRQVRRFAGFVALSMLAYSAEEILLEPFAGTVFRLAPAQTALLTGLQHSGALFGMLLVALASHRSFTANVASRLPSLRGWTIGGCVLSALSLALLALCGIAGTVGLLRPMVLALGLGNGVFAVAAIGSMMQLASQAGGHGGVRIGFWGAAQALAFAAGGLAGAAATDAARAMLHDPARAYGLVLTGEMLLFLLAARQASRAFPVAPANRLEIPAGRAEVII